MQAKDIGTLVTKVNERTIEYPSLTFCLMQALNMTHFNYGIERTIDERLHGIWYTYYNASVYVANKRKWHL